nr:LON peptidase substrate-binding domain-containing protein [Anaerolineae bacterium]
MTDLRELPLFPLNTVLFPGMTLPLHIFEPRYRLMIGRCLQLKRPFGVVLIREGLEVGGAAPYSVGTEARITRSEQISPDRMLIEVVGNMRFRIAHIKQESPYLIGLVQDYPVRDTETRTTRAIIKRIIPRVRTYLDTLVRAMETDLEISDIPEEGRALAIFTAVMVPLPLEDKQQILEMPGVHEMLEYEDSLMRRELMLLNYMRVRQAPAEPPGTLFSVN